jgi:molybdopterin synthase catalytic subunit
MTSIIHMIRLQSESFDPDTELRTFREQNLTAGAIASFCGYVRGDEGRVQALELQHYPSLCEQEIKAMVQKALARFEAADCLVIHRFGRMLPGEVIVLVAASAAHRKPALACVDYVMDFLKTSAPFWKRETLASGARWIEPTETDYAASRSWSDKEQA